MATAVGEVLAALAHALTAVHGRWYLFGAQAALVHGASRLTADVDATVLWDPADASELIEQLTRNGFELRPTEHGFIERTRVIPLVHAGTGMQTDLVLGGAGLEEAFLERAREHDVDGVRIPVATPEDLIAMKVLGGRPKDLDDVHALLGANRETLDLDYVRGVLRELEAALDRSDLVPVLEAAVSDVR